MRVGIIGGGISGLSSVYKYELTKWNILFY